MSFGGFSPIPRKRGSPQEQKPLGVVQEAVGAPQQPPPPGLGVVQPPPTATPPPAPPPNAAQAPPVIPSFPPASRAQPAPVDPFVQPPAPPAVQSPPVTPPMQPSAPAVVQSPVVMPFAQPVREQRFAPSMGVVHTPAGQVVRQYNPPPLPPTGPPDPDAIAVVGRFGPWPWGQWPDEAYLAQALEAMGKRVVRIDQDHPNAQPPPALWAVCTAYPNSMEKVHRWEGVRNTVLWTLDWLLHDNLRQPAIEAARRATLFASSDQWDWATTHGIMRHFYLPGACEGICPDFRPAPVRKCAFMGSLYSDRRRRIAAVVRSMGGVVLDHPGAWLYSLDLARFVQETKVIVGDNTRNDVQGYWSSRNYIIPGAGGFLLTSRVPGLEAQFTPDEHVGVYDSMDELAAKIEWWCSNDAERERVRHAGFFHVRRNHGWDARAKTLLAAVGSFAHERR